MEDRELEGLWWLPEEPSAAVAGVLTFANEEPIRLSLIGSLGDIESFGQPRFYPVILGATKNSKLVTLLDSQSAGGQLSVPGYASEEYSPRTVLVGGHFEAVEQASFHRIQVQYENLPEWVGASGFTRGLERDKDGKYHFSYEFPAELVARTTKGQVSVDYMFHQSGDMLSELRMRQSVYIKIEADRDIELDDWHKKFLQPLQNLLTLGIGEPTRVTELMAFSPRVTSESDKGPREMPVEVLYRQIYRGSAKRKRLAPEMIFTLSDIAQDFDQTMEAWLRVAEELDSVCNLFFGMRYAPRMYVEQRFLAVAQAAESYHRRRVNNSVLEEADHRDRVETVIEASPPEHRNWLKEVLEYSNEPRFSARMRDLFDRTAPLVEPLVPNRKRFLRTVADSRNFYTHYSESLRRRAAHRTKLLFVTEILSLIVQACLLAEVGISYDRQVHLFQRSPNYQMILDNRSQLE